MNMKLRFIQLSVLFNISLPLEIVWSKDDKVTNIRSLVYTQVRDLYAHHLTLSWRHGMCHDAVMTRTFRITGPLRGIYTNAENRSAVDRFEWIVWCCLHRRGPAAPPLISLMERFFCGTRRNRECWLVSIYRSMTQCCEKGLPQTETARGPALV